MKFYLLLALCGLTAASDFIIGGDDVTVVGKWPWQGSLRYRGYHNCGITLISSTKGLTAATCVDGYTLADLTIMFGSNDRLDNGVVVKARKVIVHEKWEEGAGAFPNDIAIVEFDKAVSGASIAAVRLTEKGKDHAGNSDCWITGWGDEVNGGTLPKTLQEAHVNVYTNTKCKESWGDNINDGHVCIGDSVNKRTSCHGDGGSPLVCKVDGQFVLVGIHSWLHTGCSTSFPAGYTRIAYFRDWVRTNAGV